MEEELSLQKSLIYELSAACVFYREEGIDGDGEGEREEKRSLILSWQYSRLERANTNRHVDSERGH